MKLIMTLSYMTSLFMLNSYQPIMMTMFLILQTILISFMTGMTYNSFWFAYILFMVLLGGLLILFLYTTLISMNNKFYLNNNNLIIKMILFMIILMIIYNMEFHHISNSAETLNLTMMNKDIKSMNLMKMINNQSLMLILFLMNFLYVMLLVTNKIIDIFKGPMRTTQY